MNEEQLKIEYMRARKQNIIILSVVGVLLLVALVSVGIWKYQHTFTVKKWHDDRDNRHKIVYDMLEKNEFIGMEKQQVIELLGNEDSNEQTSFKISKKNYLPETSLIYYLGVDFMDTNWLILSMEKDVVTEILIDIT